LENNVLVCTNLSHCNVPVKSDGTDTVVAVPSSTIPGSHLRDVGLDATGKQT
jgi:hypothetical protein